MKIILQELPIEDRHQMMAAPTDISSPPATDSVPANIYETTEGYRIELLAPGFEKEDFTVELDEEGILTVTAEMTEPGNENETVIRQEYGQTPFTRMFRIPDNALDDDLTIFYERGIFTVFIPKSED